jgi:hypothetical protein
VVKITGKTAIHCSQTSVGLLPLFFKRRFVTFAPRAPAKPIINAIHGLKLIKIA